MTGAEPSLFSQICKTDESCSISIKISFPTVLKSGPAACQIWEKKHMDHQNWEELILDAILKRLKLAEKSCNIFVALKLMKIYIKM